MSAAGDARSGRGRHPLLRPVWIVGHVVVLAILVAFPQFALWQWDRYREEQAVGARLEERLEAEPVPLTEVVSADMDDDELAAAEFTPVAVSGTWAADEQVAQRNRSYGGQGGFDLLTPLELGDGTAVLVRRGWVPPAQAAGATPTVDVPVEGEVEVTGYLERSGEQPSFGPTDADSGVLTTVFHADVERLDAQVAADLLPMVVHLTAQAPDDGDLPLVQPPPAHDASQNLSYTLQWSAFTLIVAIGYGIVVVRRIRDHRRGIDSDVDPYLRDRSETR